MTAEEFVNWNVELEVGLFHAMHAHKPVGMHISYGVRLINEMYKYLIYRHLLRNSDNPVVSTVLLFTISLHLFVS